VAYCTTEAAVIAGRFTPVIKGHTMFAKLEGADFWRATHGSGIV